ncbi:YjbH domain-containing protein [Tranquillimonas rosea]|uniref:YjbH domain-containing protein n=1 Tax=Tranquillimonas rosea TaxID=641238 RepID=UPI003BAB6201
MPFRTATASIPTILAVVCGATSANPQESFQGYSTYGTPGMIDMPTAVPPPDAELSFTTSYFRNTRRNTLSFQVLPRLSASLRYSQLYDFSPNPDSQEVQEFRFDRSVSLSYLIQRESKYTPAVSVGVNDFLGTSYYSSEYVAATKHLRPDLRATVGIGWGRLGGVGSFSNPLAVFSDSLEEREARDTLDGGGQLDVGNLFKGDAAFFGGLEWQATDRLQLIAEYSSDDYPYEDGFSFDQELPVNLGFAYGVTDNITLAGHYLYGSELGVRLTYAINPKEPANPSGLERAPTPVIDRGAPQAAALPTVTSANRLAPGVGQALSQQGIELHALRVDGRTAHVEIENETYPRQAQAIGRTARILTASIPASVDVFEITPVKRGLRGTTARIDRDDMEALEFEFDNAWSSYARTQFDGTPEPVTPLPGRYPEFDFGLKPYVVPTFFDPDEPVRVDFGVSAEASYEVAPGLIFSGEVRQKIVGNRGDLDRPSDSVLPKVRSNSALYQRQGTTALSTLTGAYYFKAAPRVAGRVTVGYLEQMFAGVSGELLWMPENSPVSYGIEVNRVRQREFDQGFGFQDYEVTTGHASAYWDMGNGFHSQVDVGRYLAGDWGATFTLDREFENGWKVGAFATLTDVPFEDFGEGSFDKGLRITVPINFITGEATSDDFTTTIRPVTRDGGARLNVSGRLYDTLRDVDQDEYLDGWGRFWR